MEVYCHYCKLASVLNLRVMSTKAASAFSVDGFCNWKNAVEKFKEHEKSQAHRDAVAAQSMCQLANSYKLISIKPK